MNRLTALLLAATLALPVAAAPAIKAETATIKSRVATHRAPEPAGWAMLAIGGLLVGLGLFRRPAHAEAFAQPV